MSIINNQNLTPDQIKAQQFMSSINAEDIRLSQLFTQIFDWIWNSQINPITKAPVRTPQQGFDAFGTQAAKLCIISNAYLTMIAAINNTALTSPIPAGYALTMNVDGTVIVVSPPAVPPPS